MRLRLTRLDEFETDLFALPDAETMRTALFWMNRIADGSSRGTRLADHPLVGDLGDCWKFYFDLDPAVRPRYRLVYRLLPDEVRATTVEAVAVGERADLDAYLRAGRNLGRTT